MSQVASDEAGLEERLGAIAASLRGAIEGRVTFVASDGPVWVALRREGRRLRAEWCVAGGHALARRIWELGRGAVTRPDRIEISFLRNPLPVDWETRARFLTARLRGLIGLEITCGAHVERFAPTSMIASNIGFDRAIDGFLARHGIGEKDFPKRGGALTAFDADSFLVPLDEGAAIPFFRGGRLVAEEEIDRATPTAMADALRSWLVHHIDPSGRVVYKILPSRGEVSSADNALRQFQATVALGRLSRRRGDARLAAIAERNLDATLARFLVVAGRIGMIVRDGSAGLGAAALAALAILEAPGGVERHRDAFEALSCGIDALRQENGRFRTYHLPQSRDDNQTFYPGYALTFRAARWRETRDPRLLNQIRSSVAYYRRWFDEAPRPTLALSHAEAAAILARETGDDFYSGWLLALCDRIPPFQETGAGLPPDLAGRFYDPRRPTLGRPHAATTASYVAALADGLEIAERSGDDARAAAYALSIRRGLRNLRQLQFRGSTDMYYLPRPELAAGALRAEVYDNTIRIDAVAEALRAIIKLEEYGLAGLISGTR